MKKFLLFPFIVCTFFIQAQNVTADSLQLFICETTVTADSLERLLPKLPEHKEKADLLGYLCYHYAFINADTGIKYGLRGLELSQKLDYKWGIAYCNQSLSFPLWVNGNYSESLQHALKSLQQFEELKDYPRIAYSYLALVNIYREVGDYKKGFQEGDKAIRLYDSINFSKKVAYVVIGSIYERADSLDSALNYMQKAYALDRSNNKGRWGWLVYVIGNIQGKFENYDLALAHYKTALPLVVKSNIPKDIVDIYNSIARVYKKSGKIDSSIIYSNDVLQKLKSTSYKKGMLEAANNLSDIYKSRNQTDSTIKYLEMGLALNNELFTLEKERVFQNLAFDEQIRRQEMEQATLQAAKERMKNLQLLAIAAFIMTFLVAVIVISRRKTLLKTARFLGLIGVLLIFEFLNLLTHPWIEGVTHGNPFLTLLILVLLASFLVPAHHGLEEMVKKKLVRKRKTKSTKAFNAKTDTSKPESLS